MTTSQTHRRELILTLEGLKNRIAQAEPECSCEVFEDLAEPNRFLWSEWWMSLEQIRIAKESERFRALLGAVKVLGSLESVRQVNRTPDGDRDDGRGIQQKHTSSGHTE